MTRKRQDPPATTRPYVVAYARTSTRSQNAGIQLDALNAAGADRVFEEQESGAKQNRPVLTEALKTLRPGDVLLVWKLDRLARSLGHLKQIADDLKARGVHLRSLTEGFDTSTASGTMVFHMIGTMAEFERSLIEERREVGLARARAAGKKFGRKLASDPTAKGGQERAGRMAMAMQAVQRGDSLRAAAGTHGVSRATLSRHLSINSGTSDLSIHSSRAKTTKPGLNGLGNGTAHI